MISFNINDLLSTILNTFCIIVFVMPAGAKILKYTPGFLYFDDILCVTKDAPGGFLIYLIFKGKGNILWILWIILDIVL